MWFKVWEYHLSTKAIRRQYYPVFKVKIYSGTDNFQTTYHHRAGSEYNK